MSVRRRPTRPAGVTVLVCAIAVFIDRAAALQSTALQTKAASQKAFYCDDRAGNNQVTVFSESTLEDFTGVCNRVSGQCAFDPRKVETLSGKFAIRVEDLKTGIDLRDHHMVGPDWLDAAHNPEISVRIDRVEEVKKTAPNSATLTLVGTCNIHGKAQPVRIPANLTYLDETPETMRRVKGDLLRIRANFDIKLADYSITGPPGSDFIGMKVAEMVKVKVTIVGSTEKPADPLKADRPDSTAERVPAGRPERPASRPTRMQ